MAVRINARELESLLAATPASQNIMLTGKHGIGKSQILERFFTSRGERVVTLFLGQMSDPGDLIGLPRLDEATGKTHFMPPYWFPTDGKPVVLFLDELNRARPEVLQTVMDLTLNRTLAGRKLPEGSRVISAVNDGEEYQLTDLDPALVSRFNIYEFKPTAQEWLLWASKAGLDSRVILDTSGAESLIGNGDLLLSKPEYPKPVRIQGCFTSDDEIAAVVEAVKAQVTSLQADIAQREATIDSVLLILHDWSHNLTLDPKEIDKERTREFYKNVKIDIK